MTRGSRTTTNRYAARRGILPNMPMISVNTWIIIINVVVYALGVTVLSGRVTVSAGVEVSRELSAAEKQSVYVEKSVYKPDANDPSLYSHPIFVPVAPGMEGVVGRPVVIHGRYMEFVGNERYRHTTLLEGYGHFSTGKAFSELELWRFVTFQFLHANYVHLLLNMLGLWFVGGVVEDYLGRRRYGAFYLTCGVMGAVSYLILNLAGYYAKIYVPGMAHAIPFVLVTDPYVPLVGASAGVFGVLLAAAFIAPNAIVDVMFVLPMRLRTAVYLFLGIAFVNLMMGGSNAGGDAAHVGGAIAGAYLIRRTHKLRDILAIFGLGIRSSRGQGRTESLAGQEWSRTIEEELLRIQEKIREVGVEGLTVEERQVLARMARESAGG